MATAPVSLPITLADYERQAAGLIEPGALGYFPGGAGDAELDRSFVIPAPWVADHQ